MSLKNTVMFTLGLTLFSLAVLSRILIDYAETGQSPVDIPSAMFVPKV